MDTKKLYLNGEWVDTGDYFTVVDPGNGETLAQVAAAGPDVARKAVDDAWEAFGTWRHVTGIRRGDYLLAVARCLEKRKEEIGRTVVRENGKPLGQGIGEVNVAIDHLRWFAEEARRGYGRIIPNQADGKRHLVVQQPVGPVAAISPWNFPLVLSVRKIAPALAAGCTAILRPASQTPLCNVALAECFEEAQIPKGVFQLIAGPASKIVGEFMDHPKLRKISFTGSTEVGKKLLQQSATTVTKLSLELGGHAPVVVFEDADLDRAVEGALITKFRNTGQSCIAANRIYVQSSIYEEFLKRFGERASQLKVGYGLDDGVDIGAIVNKEGLDTGLAHIENAKQTGARLISGGNVVQHEKGYFLEPTVLADVPETAACMQEETFAPIAPVVSFDTEEEAIAQANNNRYGLAAYLYTDNLNRGLRVAEALEAGTVGLNDAVPSTSNAPFGGYKESGLGRELGTEGMEAFMETKHISLGGVDT